MKAQSLSIILLALYSAGILAAAPPEIEIQVITLRGSLPSEDKIIRLLDSDQIIDPSALSAKLEVGGRFAVDKTKKFRFGAEFDRDGKVLKQLEKPLGRTLSGTARKRGNVYEVALQFHETKKTGDQISESESGAAISQPLLATTRGSASFTIKPDRWILISLAGSEDGAKKYLAARIKTTVNGEQDAADQEPARRESNAE